MRKSLTSFRTSSRQLLARILETHQLAEQIQALPSGVLGRLIDHIGLEDAGEIVTLATTEQLAEVFDEDLWKSERPGEDETFDADRFLVWLEVMLEAGDSFVARKLTELPEQLVTLAFHRQLLVLSVDQLMTDLREASEEDADATEKALSNCLSEELDEHQIISRHHDGWDNVLAAILALDRDHHDFLVRLLDRCCKMSAGYIEDNGGLYEVLSAEEMLESDVSAEREDRRAEKGHVAPSSAVAFLRLARSAGETPPTEHDPLTRAYLRTVAPRTAGTDRSSGPSDAKPRDLAHLLQSAGLWEQIDAPRLPAPATGDDGTSDPLLIRALARLSEDAPRDFYARSEELAYLANVLAAGCTIEGRRLRPVEAVRAAIAACNLGLELVLGARKRGDLGAAVDALRKHPADGLFRVAWSRPERHSKIADLREIREAKG
jgi:hypothetical protein